MSKIWLDERKLSSWAKNYCINKKDDPEIRKYITNCFDYTGYLCSLNKEDPYFIENISKMGPSEFVRSDLADKYCRKIKDDSNIREYITRPVDAKWYCDKVRNDIPWLRKLSEKCS